MSDWARLQNYEASWLHAPVVTSSIGGLQVDTVVSLCAVAFQVDPVAITSAGRVAFSSVLVGQCGTPFFRVTMWRDRSRWVERFRVGDVILMTDIRVRMWRGRPHGSTTSASRLFNLNPAEAPPSSHLRQVCLDLAHLSSERLPRLSLSPPRDRPTSSLSSRTYVAVGEIVMATCDGTFIGPAVIHTIGRQVPDPSSVVDASSFAYRGLPVRVNGVLDCMACPDVVRSLCGGLCPKLAVTTHRHVVTELFACLNANGNSPFTLARIDVRVAVDRNGVVRSRQSVLRSIVV
ncbi:Shieldin complex subunit 2 first OB fold domain-containing protein [Plasmodiophora brassicae]|uniref:Shieldin complex subunit 2 first OB fold domain-containing protein n=1 Tax=Plasmodiophora brassicae TaxID=37360 RepID=A0A3P3YIK1_PLABS|nr:unnamed protein product [Plasmodiophora brassicae]